MATIVEDTRQKVGKHGLKNGWWAAHGVDVVRRKLDFGDYLYGPSNVVVDTKQDLMELAMDLGRDHARFVRECERAAGAGFRLVVLTEQAPPPGVPAADWVSGWVNDRCSGCPHFIAFMGKGGAEPCHPNAIGRNQCRRYRYRPMPGWQLSKTIGTVAARHGARFSFCPPADAAQAVCDLMGVPYIQ